MDKIIEVKNLCKSYRGVTAVDDVSFCVKKGELFAFLGINGAGKSTTINILCGALSKDSGTVYVDGLDIDKNLMEVKNQLGIVFQNSVLDAKLSVYDNLKIKAALYSITGDSFKKRLAELNELLDLNSLLNRPLEKLSGGQRRRIDIARALLHNPKVLILDEPTTGLDPQTRAMVWKCLNKLRQDNNMTIFLTTHYMEEAAEADFVVIIDSGKVVANNTPNELKNQYVSDFIRIYNRSDKLLNMLANENLKYVDKDVCIEIEVASTAKARDLLVAYPELFNDFEVVKGKMDDVFLKVTGKELNGGENYA